MDNNEKIYKLPVFGIERHRFYIDGEGITTLVGSYGCPLRCKYCINSLAWDVQTLKKVRYFTAKELYDALKIDQLYFLSTNGGVTFGGGEALLHAAFFREFREMCGSAWNLTVETSLNVPRRLLEKTLDVIDDYRIDIKDINNNIYEEYTGCSNEKVVDNLKFLLKNKSVEHIFVRVPNIPKYNNQKDIEKTIEFLKSIGIKNIEVFTYIVKGN